MYLFHVTNSRHFLATRWTKQRIANIRRLRTNQTSLKWNQSSHYSSMSFVHPHFILLQTSKIRHPFDFMWIFEPSSDICSWMIPCSHTNRNKKKVHTFAPSQFIHLFKCIHILNLFVSYFHCFYFLLFSHCFYCRLIWFSCDARNVCWWWYEWRTLKAITAFGWHRRSCKQMRRYQSNKSVWIRAAKYKRHFYRFKWYILNIWKNILCTDDESHWI